MISQVAASEKERAQTVMLYKQQALILRGSGTLRKYLQYFKELQNRNIVE